jgi:hypothetical protein
MEDAKKRLEGMEYMGYGLLALFVMLAVWGLVYFVSATLQIGVGGTLNTIPSFVD